MNSKIEKLIQNVSEHTNTLKVYVETHVDSSVDFDFVDELTEAIDVLNEVAYDLECRASDAEE
jgi:hypothetical protein